MTDDTEWIQTRQDFVKFLNQTHISFLEKPQDWENNNLERFLEALSAYANDIDGFYKNSLPNDDPEKPTWRIFAQIISGASIYE